MTGKATREELLTQLTNERAETTVLLTALKSMTDRYEALLGGDPAATEQAATIIAGTRALIEERHLGAEMHLRELESLRRALDAARDEALGANRLAAKRDGMLDAVHAIINRPTAEHVSCECKGCMRARKKAQADGETCRDCGYAGLMNTSKCGHVLSGGKQCEPHPDRMEVGCTHGYLRCPVCADARSKESGWARVREVRRIVEES